MSTYGARESGRGDYWAAFAAMATDITDICPMMVSQNISQKLVPAVVSRIFFGGGERKLSNSQVNFYRTLVLFRRNILLQCFTYFTVPFLPCSPWPALPPPTSPPRCTCTSLRTARTRRRRGRRWWTPEGTRRSTPSAPPPSPPSGRTWRPYSEGGAGPPSWTGSSSQTCRYARTCRAIFAGLLLLVLVSFCCCRLGTAADFVFGLSFRIFYGGRKVRGEISVVVSHLGGFYKESLNKLFFCSPRTCSTPSRGRASCRRTRTCPRESTRYGYKGFFIKLMCGKLQRFLLPPPRSASTSPPPVSCPPASSGARPRGSCRTSPESTEKAAEKETKKNEHTIVKRTDTDLPAEKNIKQFTVSFSIEMGNHHLHKFDCFSLIFRTSKRDLKRVQKRGGDIPEHLSQ